MHAMPVTEPRKAASRPPWRTDLTVLLLIVIATSVPFWIAGERLDIALQRPFYAPVAGGQPWHLQNRFPWRQLYLYGTLPALATAVAAAVVAAASFLRPRLRRWRPHALFLVLTMAVGPGLLVNGLFKDHWGRPRPRQIKQFGGTWDYQAPLVKGPSGRGKAFPCGHSSTGYYFVALFFLLRRRHKALAIAALAAGVALGTLIGMARMAAGAHFASDVVWSAHLTLLPAFVLYYGVLRIPAQARAAQADGPAGRVRWVGAVLVAGMAVGIAAAALLVLRPLYLEIRHSAPRATARVPLSLDCAAADLTLTFTNLADQAFVIGGDAQGFGVPWATFNPSLQTAPGAGAAYCFTAQPRGYFRELRVSLAVLVDPSAVDRLTVRVGHGTIRVQSATPLPPPPLEITLDNGDLTVAESLRTNMVVRRNPGGASACRYLGE